MRTKQTVRVTRLATKGIEKISRNKINTENHHEVPSPGCVCFTAATLSSRSTVRPEGIKHQEEQWLTNKSSLVNLQRVI